MPAVVSGRAQVPGGAAPGGPLLPLLRLLHHRRAGAVPGPLPALQAEPPEGDLLQPARQALQQAPADHRAVQGRHSNVNSGTA